MWTLLISGIIFLSFVIILESYTLKRFGVATLAVIIMVIGFTTIVTIDYSAQTYDHEVYSGKVVDWNHEEEYDVYHPSVCTTVNNVSSCSVAYTEHVDAQNSIETTDDGWVDVYRTPDGSKKFTDSWPNDESVLKEYWREGSATASVHRFTNKVKASDSLYRVRDIDLTKFTDLPEYNVTVNDDLTIDRIIGDVPNKKESLKELNNLNTYLNRPVANPEKPGKTISWKQVNLVFVNVGSDKNIDYAYALQNKWKNGKKNDFIVSFSMNGDGKLNWVYVFSWSEVELLKKDVRDTLMNIGTITDFKPIINEVGDMVAKDFKRKQFADFDYISITISPISQFIIVIFTFALGIFYFYYFKLEKLQYDREKEWMDRRKEMNSRRIDLEESINRMQSEFEKLHADRMANKVPVKSLINKKRVEIKAKVKVNINKRKD